MNDISTASKLLDGYEHVTHGDLEKIARLITQQIPVVENNGTFTIILRHNGDIQRARLEELLRCAQQELKIRTATKDKIFSVCLPEQVTAKKDAAPTQDHRAMAETTRQEPLPSPASDGATAIDENVELRLDTENAAGPSSTNTKPAATSKGGGAAGAAAEILARRKKKTS